MIVYDILFYSILFYSILDYIWSGSDKKYYRLYLEVGVPRIGLILSRKILSLFSKTWQPDFGVRRGKFRTNFVGAYLFDGEIEKLGEKTPGCAS